MAEIGVKQIDIIAGKQKTGNKKQNKEDKTQIKNTTQNDKIIKLYKKLLGQNISENVEIKTTKEVQEIKKKIIKRTSEEKVQKEGNKLLEKIETLYSSGSTGEEIIKTLKTNKIKEPLSIYNRQDCKNVGISEEDFNILQNYYVPEAKKKLFSNAIINLIIESKMLLTSGKTLEELFPLVHKTCEKHNIDGNLLYKWKGKSDKNPILFRQVSQTLRYHILSLTGYEIVRVAVCTVHRHRKARKIIRNIRLIELFPTLQNMLTLVSVSNAVITCSFCCCTRKALQGHRSKQHNYNKQSGQGFFK